MNDARLRLVAAFLAAALASLACGGGGTSGPAPSTPAGGTPSAPGGTPPLAHGWNVVAREDFEATAIPPGAFAPDDAQTADGPYGDGGLYFTSRGVTPPAAFRAAQPFGANGWLTLESYTRRAGAALSELAAIVPDPAGGTNHVLRIRSPEHTDGTIVRPSAALPARYRVSLRVGFPSFGDGAGQNGYVGAPDAGPWWPDEDARQENGFYWITILDARPRPHNNTWIHHERKVVVDSDNHYPPWMQIWNGSGFIWSGVHPVMMFALDGSPSSPGSTHNGNPFYSWSNGAWQPSGAIRAVDAYVPDTWYRVSVERDGPSYTVEISGTFAYGGAQTYRATIDAAATCVWHYPVNAEEAAGAARCETSEPLPDLPAEPAFARWPAGKSWPDWFMFGDPHVNYYAGEVYYDDVTLEVWQE
jgi:hypothetical protein